MRGLLFVLSDPGTAALGRFHAWYDEEHGPQRMALDGLDSGDRFAAADGVKPGWLATYDIDLELLETPAYRELREHRSPGEEAIMSELAALDRRVYELISDHGGGEGPPPVLVATSLSVSPDAEDELAAWYADEHIPMLHAIPGWLRTRRFRLRDGDAPRLLALHELSGPKPLTTDAYRAATGTEWRARVMASVEARERRVFRHHRTFRSP